MVVLNRPDPKRAPIDMKMPSDSDPAENDAMMSGAPLEKARRVTPARVSGRARSRDSLASRGERYVSAVRERRLKHMASRRMVIRRVRR